MSIARVLALALRTAEFLFYHLLISLVDRVSRLPREGVMPDYARGLLHGYELAADVADDDVAAQRRAHEARTRSRVRRRPGAPSDGNAHAEVRLACARSAGGAAAPSPSSGWHVRRRGGRELDPELVASESEQRVGERVKKHLAAERPVLVGGVAVARRDEGGDGMGRPGGLSHGPTFARHRRASEAIAFRRASGRRLRHRGPQADGRSVLVHHRTAPITQRPRDPLVNSPPTLE